MERKIGEIFECNDEFFQCVESSGCALCAFNETDCEDIDTGCCEVNTRSDRKSVIFKRLEKVGEPIEYSKGRFFQKLKSIDGHTCTECDLIDIDSACYLKNCDVCFYKEINQTKEDMEEDNNTKHSNSENIGKNLKPFDLEAAKSGKPVCTRDGKKARIICFDVKGSTYPIIALIEEGEDERLCSYMPNGRRYEDEEEWKDDLMMLPEKKEGWVNLYRDEESKRVYCGESIFSEREKAEKHFECNDTKVATVSIGWEE